MPRYFFNIDDHRREEDLQGTMLAGIEEARATAVVFAGECLRDDPDLVWDGQRFVVEVQDESRARVLTVTVAAEGPAAG